MLRKVMYVFLIIFFALASIAAYIFISGAQKAGDVAESARDLVQQLVVPVTPAILPSPSTILMGVTEEARLVTVTADYEKVIVAERNQDVLWGALGEQLIFVANGTVVAGVDLSQMDTSDIQVVDPNTVQVRLPPAQIFEDLSHLNNESSYVADRDTGLLTRADPELETRVRQAAEQEILEAAHGSDIIERANVKAQMEVGKIIEGLGYEVLFFEEELPPVTPYQQEVPKGFEIEGTVTVTAVPSATPTP